MLINGSSTILIFSTLTIGTGYFGDGTAASPSITFTSDPDTGFYKYAANIMGLALGGASRLIIGHNGTGTYGQNITGSALWILNDTGSVEITASGANQNITLTPSGTGFVAIPASYNLQLQGGQLFANRIDGYTGNYVLFGTSTNSSNGYIQLATHTTSAGGIGFGTGFSLYSASATRLVLDGSAAQFDWAHAGTSKLRIETSGDDCFISTLSAAGDIFIRTGNSVLALTLDSTQKAIFSGAIRLSNAAAAGAVVPTHTVVIEDSTGTAYRVPCLV